MVKRVKSPNQRTRRRLASVVSSRLFYGAPFWYLTVSCKALSWMSSAICTIMLRVACCYRTLSFTVGAVLSMVPPLPLFADQQTKIYGGMYKLDVRKYILDRWQRKWTDGDNGRWTHRLIGDIRKQIKWRHGETYFYLTQVLTGYGKIQ